MSQLILNRNETLQGPAPACLEVLRNFPAERAAIYLPGYGTSQLVPKLSQRFQVPADQIVLSYGMEDFFRTVFGRLQPSTDSVLIPRYSYGYYRKQLHFLGVKVGRYEVAKQADRFVYDLDDCLKRYATHQPKLFIITSPNSPTGNSIEAQGVERLLQAMEKDAYLLVDEAYIGFEPEYDEQAMLQLVHRYPNLIISRTFSKYYALAGLRIGYAFVGTAARQWLGYAERELGFSRILEEIAIAALDSEVYYQAIGQEVRADRAWFIAETNSLAGFKAYQSQANFVLVESDPSIRQAFNTAVAALPVVVAKDVEEGYLRVTITPRKYLEPILELMRKYSNDSV